MTVSIKTKENIERLLDSASFISETEDPEFYDFFNNFVYDEVDSQGNIDERTKHLAILSSLLGCQAKELFQVMITAALNAKVTPIEIKEVIYQSVAYLGIGKVYPFLKITNQVFKDEGIQLPLEPQSTTDNETRLLAGAQAQVDIFGEHMVDFYKSGPKESMHINRWLAGNCFGDYYTRTGLNHKEREMITLCFLAAQGGCEPQLTSHAGANMKVGNDKQFLIDVISQCMPFIGYPRTLNALRCINEAAK